MRVLSFEAWLYKHQEELDELSIPDAELYPLYQKYLENSYD